jgi:excinuclease ABC subunit C
MYDMVENGELRKKLANLPDSPGVYQFYDKDDKLLYIGKAKSLKKRVSSYFNKQQNESAKLKILVRKIERLEHILVESESDALLLENNLIKKYQPKYNVNLKDDKTFPWICVKNERFPRVFSTRSLVKDGSRYYGPYTSAQTVRTLLSLIRELYMLRNCKLKLSEENIQQKKFKVCLEYHLKNCKGPCEGLQSEEEYNQTIEQVHNILKGNLNDVIGYLKLLMKQYAEDYKFEEAESIKNKISALEKFQMKSTIVNPSIHNVEVYSFDEDEKFGYVNFLKIINGAIVQAHTVEIKKKLEESREELLSYAILELRERLYSDSKEIILPFRLNELPEGIKQHIPQKGDKKKLLDLSTRNAKYFMLEKKKRKAETQHLAPVQRILNTMQKDLRMNEKPVHIECFDNSNLQGSNPVAACVVFRNLKPSKKDYRHYNIKTVKGPDDYASMKEVVSRRYSRLLREDKDLPQLIVIDGGKGQLNAAVSSLSELELRGKISIIGIAKRLEEIYFPDDPVPIYIDKNSETLKIIQQLRNEAHRFGIKFHRQKRSGSMLKTSLENIPGIGEKTVEDLIHNFRSVENLKNVTFETMAGIIGKKRAELVQNYLNDQDS